MNATLPPPGSIWINKATQKPMRIVYSEYYEIIAHDAERADELRQITSWRGNIHHFKDAFDGPADPTEYPQTAS